ncbi:MAG TPA: hypothetical protein VHF22_11465 [Planctomycetota bacterium]|nr:hypothetical protein [Planctomycetota bacterium]
MSHGDRRLPLSRSGGKLSSSANLPDDARALLTGGRAERLVYLFPDGFASDRLVEDQTSASRPVFDFESLITPDYPPDDGYTFVGHVEKEPFAVEVRARSATIIADQFRVRLDLLLALKEYAAKRRQEDAA